MRCADYGAAISVIARRISRPEMKQANWDKGTECVG